MAKNSIKKITKKIWQSIVFGGIVSVLFGLLAIFWTDWTLATLVLMCGVFMVVMGIIWLVESLASIKSDPLWWLGLLFAVLACAGGVFLLCNPSITIKIFVVLLAVYIFVQSLLDLIVASYTEKKGDKWMWIIMGLLGVAFGILVVAHPLAASVAFVWVIGLYALIRGILSLIFAARVHKYIGKAPKSKKKKS